MLALISILIVLAGFHLLWQSRREVAFWLRRYPKIFRASLRESERPPAKQFPQRREHVLRILLGLGLVFFVGPVLIVLGLIL